jgi:hypothetical protein
MRQSFWVPQPCFDPYINVHHRKHVIILYIKETTNTDPLKPKVMKLTYKGKTTFNLNGTTIHYALAILLNIFFNEFKSLNDVNHDTLTRHMINFN